MGHPTSLLAVASQKNEEEIKAGLLQCAELAIRYVIAMNESQDVPARDVRSL